MAKWILGNTKLKGCYVCGKPLARFMSGQAWVLDGSKGRIAVCSTKCQNDFDPDKVLESADLTGGGGSSTASKPLARRKVKRLGGRKVRIKGETSPQEAAATPAPPAKKTAKVKATTKKKAATKKVAAAPAAKKTATKKTAKTGTAKTAAKKATKKAATKKK